MEGRTIIDNLEAGQNRIADLITEKRWRSFVYFVSRQEIGLLHPRGSFTINEQSN